MYGIGIGIESKTNKQTDQHTYKQTYFLKPLFRVCATDIIHKVSSVTLNVSTRVTLQNNTLQSIKPFTILIMAPKATFGVNTNVGHTLQYWISQPAIPFVPEV